jgi:membrane-bound lytic murein transglycosylase B
MNPLQPTGSYAGAMGIPQFMPSSYRSYAADYENDGKSDIWKNPADAIASVANYFVIHHWRKGEDVAFLVKSEGEQYQEALSKGLKPNLTWAALQAMAVTAEQKIAADAGVKLLAFQQEDSKDLWVGLNNFYVITRYNHSPMYAMAVFQLSQEIYQQRQQLKSSVQNK